MTVTAVRQSRFTLFGVPQIAPSPLRLSVIPLFIISATIEVALAGILAICGFSGPRTDVDLAVHSIVVDFDMMGLSNGYRTLTVT